MFKNSHRLFPLIVLCLVILLISASTVRAQSDQGIVVFKKIGVFDPEDRTRQEFGKIIVKQIRWELASTFRFEVVPQQKLSKTLPLPTPDLIDLGKRFELDGIISGMVEITGNDLKIGLTLLEAETGVPFAMEFIVVKDWKSPDAVEKGVRTIINRLIGRLPYKAVVTEVQDNGKTIMVGAGRLRGLNAGMKLEVFRIKRVSRHPFTNEVIGVDKVVVGELIVTRADERMSAAKLFRREKGQVFTKGQYVVFKPSAKVLSEMASRRDELLAQQERDWTVLEEAALKEAALKEAALKEERAPVQKVSRGKLELGAGSALSNFSLNSDQFEFDRKISAFPLMGVSGEYWVVPSIGLDADYQIGFVKLERLGSGSINVRARPYWYATHLKYRYILWSGTTDLELIGRVGYAWYTYRVSETDSQFLINTRYRGPSIGLEGRLPLTSKITTSIGVDYQPVLRVDEHPVSSGEDSSSHSIRFHAEGRYRLQSGLWLSVRYLFRTFIADFSGTGSRAGGVTGTETREILNAATIGLVAEF